MQQQHQQALHTLLQKTVVWYTDVPCLDDDDDDDDGETSSLTDRDVAIRLWHGGSSYANNRWFDKSIQLVVTAGDAQLGLIGEHFMIDCMPAV